MTSPGAKKGLRLGGGDGVRYEETERLSRSSSSVAELYTVPYDDILKAVVELGVTSIEVRRIRQSSMTNVYSIRGTRQLAMASTMELIGGFSSRQNPGGFLLLLADSISRYCTVPVLYLGMYLLYLGRYM